MKATYGQLIDGKRITLEEYERQVIKGCVWIVVQPTDREIKSLYNKGYSVEDAVSHLIVKS